MANTIVKSDIVVPLLGEFERNMQILMNGSTQFNKNYVGGHGSTINAVIPSYGTTSTGASVASNISAVTGGKVPITLLQYNQAVELTQVQQALELSDFEGQVGDPYGMKMASDIQTIAATTIMLAHDTIDVIGSGTAGYSNIGSGIGVIKSARAYGEMVGCLSNDLASQVQNSGLTLFNPSTQISNSFLNGGLGKYRGADWYETPDIAPLVTGTCTGFTVTSISTEGTTALAVTAATSGHTLKAGQSFTIPGHFAVDIYGVALSSLYQFIVQSDYTFPGTTGTVPVKALYMAAGPLKNISVSAVVGAVTMSHATSTTYYRGFMWAKPAFVYASAPMKKLTMVESFMGKSPKGLTLLGSTGTDIKAGTDIIRWDTLAGFAILRSNWVRGIHVKV